MPRKLTRLVCKPPPEPVLQVNPEFDRLVERALVHMMLVLEHRGYIADPAELRKAWSDYSEGFCATWLSLPGPDDRLFQTLMRLMEPAPEPDLPYTMSAVEVRRLLEPDEDEDPESALVVYWVVQLTPDGDEQIVAADTDAVLEVLANLRDDDRVFVGLDREDNSLYLGRPPASARYSP